MTDTKANEHSSIMPSAHITYIEAVKAAQLARHQCRDELHDNSITNRWFPPEMPTGDCNSRLTITTIVRTRQIKRPIWHFKESRVCLPPTGRTRKLLNKTI